MSARFCGVSAVGLCEQLGPGEGEDDVAGVSVGVGDGVLDERPERSRAPAHLGHDRLVPAVGQAARVARRRRRPDAGGSGSGVAKTGGDGGRSGGRGRRCRWGRRSRGRRRGRGSLERRLEPREALVERLGREVAGGPARPARAPARAAGAGRRPRARRRARRAGGRPAGGRSPARAARPGSPIAGPLVVGDGRLGRQLPELLLEEDQPQVGEEVGDERPEVGPGVGLRVDRDAGSRRRRRRRPGR